MALAGVRVKFVEMYLIDNSIIGYSQSKDRRFNFEILCKLEQSHTTICTQTSEFLRNNMRLLSSLSICHLIISTLRMLDRSFSSSEIVSAVPYAHSKHVVK